jgi:tRNA/rRNA methyltransferase
VSITIILSNPQMGENIGSVARVMCNFGCSSLRIINPRDGWPNAKAKELAASSSFVLDKAEIYKTMDDAILGINLLYGTIATKRFIVKPILKPREAILEVCNYEEDVHIGFLFGCERSGLTNEELTICDSVINIPTSKLNHSLNIAQAVAIICYENFIAQNNFSLLKEKLPTPANKIYMKNLFDYLDKQLTEKNHFKSQNMKPIMMQNIKNSLIKAKLTEQEVNTLFGVFKTLNGG